MGLMGKVGYTGQRKATRFSILWYAPEWDFGW